MEGIKNYYEEAVVAKIGLYAVKFAELSDSDLSDIACIALNQLPARYFRHGIDLSFYTDAVEQSKMDKKIENAIDLAFELVKKSPHPDLD